MVAAATELVHDPRPGEIELKIASGIATPVSDVGVVLGSIAGREVVRVDGAGGSLEDVRITVPPTDFVLNTRRADERIGFTPELDLRA